jgi:3',5'-nucleoside bisphosphate phosphatase
MDLHCHSTASDGRLHPAELVERASANRLTVLALTDHDTFAGLPEAAEACERAGIRFVPGVELSTVHRGRRLHLLAWFPSVGSWSTAFEGHLAVRARARVQRLHAIAERLVHCGVPIDADALEASSQHGAVTRAHIARALLAAGHIGRFQEAFDRFLGEGRPAYVPPTPWETADAVAAVHEAGGLCGVAHPEPDGFGEPDLLALRKLGMDAVEVVHPGHARQTRRRLRRLAGRFDLLMTGGSDFHGQPGSRLLPRGHLGEPMKQAFLEALDA